MKRADYNASQTKRALSFFRAFVRKLTTGKFTVIHWGWWYIGNNKFGLSLYWEAEDE